MEKFQQKLLGVLGYLSRLRKGLENIKNAPDDTVPVPVEDPIKLIEQTVLLLGQASSSILYSQRLQILKTLTKDPKKAKNILKEKADLLKKGDQNLFGKKFRSHVVETERSKKRTLEVFSGGNRSTPPPAKQPFWTGPSPNSNKPYGGGRFYYSKKPNNNGAVMSHVSKFLIKTSSLIQKISSIDSRRVSNKCSTFSKKFVYRKNPKPAIGRKISPFQQQLGKTDPRLGNFISSKGIRDTILESSSAMDYSKTGDNVQNTEIVNKSGDYGNAGQRSHIKSGTSIPRSIPE